MDMMMPTMDGPTAIRMLKKIKSAGQIVTRSVGKHGKFERVRTGVKAFRNPYTVQELLNHN